MTDLPTLKSIESRVVVIVPPRLANSVGNVPCNLLFSVSTNAGEVSKSVYDIRLVEITNATR